MQAGVRCGRKIAIGEDDEKKGPGAYKITRTLRLRFNETKLGFK